MWFNKIVLLSIGLFLSSQVVALSTDREQPISIASDRATIDDANKIAIYEGHVVITQGSIQIDADKVTINYSDKQSIDKAVAEGKPARFKQTPDGGKDDFKAKALRMEYHANENLLDLTREAELRQTNDTFTGPHIVYDTQTGVIKADKGESKERVIVTIQPRSKATKNNNKEKSTPK
jgi:lipopolysaccharide export system protein LptA